MTSGAESEPAVVSQEIQRLELWNTMKKRGRPLAFDLEVTARCNNDCRHCYINLPANDADARSKELSVEEIARIGREAVAMGAVWCLISGGEPLLREDFAELYLALKLQGLLVSVFTNACLVAPEHVSLWKRYPPRDVEVTVYGATQATYERVTRRPGAYAAFRRGLELLAAGGVPLRLKAMALKSNVHELAEIGRFGRRYTKDYYRFDPVLHLRYDGNARRNEDIRSERLSPGQIAAIECMDAQRAASLRAACLPDSSAACRDPACDRLFHCGAGQGSFTVGPDGTFRLCSSLCHPSTTYDLRRGPLIEAWTNLVPAVRQMPSVDTGFTRECRSCSAIELCPWCPAHAALETGRMEGKVEYFCQIAHARKAALEDARPLCRHGS
jgi:radical SAM protein with 4Fe4S-binding SPASM domain